MALPRVLIVDDSPALREDMAITLEMSGFEVSVASDGVEALRVMAEGPHPNVILLDLLMPGMDGPQFLEHLRATPGNEDVAVVVVTGLTSPHVRRLVKADAFLFKPFGIDELTSVVRRVGERKGPPT